MQEERSFKRSEQLLSVGSPRLSPSALLQNWLFLLPKDPRPAVLYDGQSLHAASSNAKTLYVEESVRLPKDPRPAVLYDGQSLHAASSNAKTLYVEESVRTLACEPSGRTIAVGTCKRVLVWFVHGPLAGSKDDERVIVLEEKVENVAKSLSWSGEDGSEKLLAVFPHKLSLWTLSSFEVDATKHVDWNGGKSLSCGTWIPRLSGEVQCVAIGTTEGEVLLCSLTQDEIPEWRTIYRISAPVQHLVVMGVNRESPLPYSVLVSGAMNGGESVSTCVKIATQTTRSSHSFGLADALFNVGVNSEPLLVETSSQPLVGLFATKPSPLDMLRNIHSVARDPAEKRVETTSSTTVTRHLAPCLGILRFTKENAEDHSWQPLCKETWFEKDQSLLVSLSECGTMLAICRRHRGKSATVEVWSMPCDGCDFDQLLMKVELHSGETPLGLAMHGSKRCVVLINKLEDGVRKEESGICFVSFKRQLEGHQQVLVTFEIDAPPESKTTTHSSRRKGSELVELMQVLEGLRGEMHDRFAKIERLLVDQGERIGRLESAVKSKH